MLKVSIMSTLTFTLYGTSSELSSIFFPPIELDPTAPYALGLVGFYSYNSIPNIDETNNTFVYSRGDNNIFKSIRLPVGSYEIDGIEQYINKHIDDGSIDINTFYEQTKRKQIITIRPNNNTLKSEIYSDVYKIYFEQNTIGPLLGFTEGEYVPKILHESSLPVNIVKVTSIRIECNITTGSYYNGQLSHTLYEFPMDVPPGYRIQNVPRNVIYMPLNTHSISNITLNVCDQDGVLANFRGEKIVIRLELKKL